jgi:hypothetical protein
MDVHPYNGRIGIDPSPLQSDLRRGSRRHHCQDWPLRMCGKDPHCDKAVCLHKQPPGSKSGQPVWPTLHQKWVHWHTVFKPWQQRLRRVSTSPAKAFPHAAAGCDVTRLDSGPYQGCSFLKPGILPEKPEYETTQRNIS